MCKKHDHHETVASLHGGCGDVENRKHISGADLAVVGEELHRHHGYPKLVVEVGTDVHHPSLWIEGKGIAVLVRPKAMCEIEHELA